MAMYLTGYNDSSDCLSIFILWTTFTRLWMLGHFEQRSHIYRLEYGVPSFKLEILLVQLA